MRSTLRGGVTARTKRALSLAAVAGAAGLSLAPGLAMAADAAAADADQATDISGVDIYAKKDEKPSSPKLTAEPLDTPQTITVVSARSIRDQNLLTLRDILSTVPGITFGAGEGGGGYGDSINLRGYSASTDITSDGLRDSAQYTRSDPFNLEQLEVVNGANSVYAGAGSLGGSINLVSKTPRLGDRTTISAGIGTDNYGRLTVDANKTIGEGIAVRLNAMTHQNDVPGRDVETYDRWGIAPSIAFGVGGPTTVSLAYFHQEDENTPEYGVPYAANAIVNGPLPGVDPSNYYGYRNIDTQETQVDSLTGRFSHQFGDFLTLSNITRWQKVTQLAIVNPPQGTWCLDDGFSAQPGPAPGFLPVACASPGVYQPSGPRGTTRDSENQQIVSQTDLNFRFNTGILAHNLVVGFSFSNETYDLDNGNIQRTATGGSPTLPPMSIADPDTLYTGPVNYIRSALSNGELNNQAIYLFDTMTFNEQWELSGGLRYEHNDGEYISTSYSMVGGVLTPGATTRAPSDENLLSYRIGLVYKPVPNASIYLAYGNTETPSQASVNGGCSVAATNSNCDLEPEEGEVIELGAKWDVLDGRLSLTGAIFQNERSKYRVNTGLVEQALDGASRVRGVTLGATGQINERWTVLANYTYLDSEYIQSVADGVIDAQKGDPLPFTPEHALNLWTTYMVTDDIMIGYGATFSGEQTFNRPTGSPVLYSSDAYWIHNAAVTWTATENVSVQLNVKNLTDEEYYSRIRSNNGFGWATPGDARSAQVTLNYRF